MSEPIEGLWLTLFLQEYFPLLTVLIFLQLHNFKARRLVHRTCAQETQVFDSSPAVSYV